MAHAARARRRAQVADQRLGPGSRSGSRPSSTRSIGSTQFVEELVELTTETFTHLVGLVRLGDRAGGTATSASRRAPGPKPRSTPTTGCSTGSRRSARSAAPSRSTARRSRPRSPSSSSSRSTTSAASASACCSARIGSLRGTDFDTVFVVGAAEGRLPPPPRDDPLLPDRERAVTGGQVPPRSIAAARERADYLAALAGASSEVVLSWARADPVGQRALLPSRWVVETVRTLVGHADHRPPARRRRPGRASARCSCSSRSPPQSAGPARRSRSASSSSRRSTRPAATRTR